ncbi:GNAT family N-acetyltransferase [uncultured Amphritea sp.]|uniref:GNAT family N-acetyltransferase n=1 Tax=uncultured Amphritea sp. TaxID=981605 RepID=UPI002635E7A2|nr:GNAT family N-acetyltransferase [uncultured Amphritea sp.]
MKSLETYCYKIAENDCPSDTELRLASSDLNVKTWIFGNKENQTSFCLDNINWDRIYFIRHKGAAVGSLKYYLNGTGPYDESLGKFIRFYGYSVGVVRFLTNYIFIRVFVKPQSYIYHVGVNRELRGKGLGLQLLSAIKNELVDKNISCVYFDIRKGNSASNNVFNKCFSSFVICAKRSLLRRFIKYKVLLIDK